MVVTELSANRGEESFTLKIINQGPRHLGRAESSQTAKMHLDEAAASCCQTEFGSFREKGTAKAWKGQNQTGTSQEGGRHFLPFFDHCSPLTVAIKSLGFVFLIPREV